MPSQNGTPSGASSTHTSDPWSNATGSYSPPFVVADSNNSTPSDTLSITFTGFSIPAGAPILGVGIALNCYTTGAANEDYTAELTVGAALGSNYAHLANISSSTGNILGYGGATDTWGMSSSDLNAANINTYGVAIGFQVKNTDGTSGLNTTVASGSATVYFGASVVGIDGSMFTEIQSITVTVTNPPIDAYLAAETPVILGVGDLDGATWQTELISLGPAITDLESLSGGEAFGLSVLASGLETIAAADVGFYFQSLTDTDSGSLGSAFSLLPVIVLVDSDRFGLVESLGSIASTFASLDSIMALARHSLLSSIELVDPNTARFASAIAPIGALITVVDTDHLGSSEAPASFSFSIVVYLPGTNVYANDGAGGAVNYTTPIASTTGLTYSTSPLRLGGNYVFAVRNYSLSFEEKNVDARVTIILDNSGNDITNRPTPPAGLSVSLKAGGTAVIGWQWVPGGFGRPTGFHVYSNGGGSGPVNYTTPVATVTYSKNRVGFSYTLTGLTDSTSYTLGVRAYNATAEEPNTATITFTAVVNGPSPIANLTAIATS